MPDKQSEEERKLIEEWLKNNTCDEIIFSDVDENLVSIDFLAEAQP